nr:hypothetical protein [Tanacetum cinerariifolium]
AGSGPTWQFDIDTLTKTMNYQPVIAGNQSNPSNTDDDAAFAGKKPEFDGEKPNADGPSNTAISPTHRKSSYMDPSQYPDDLNMPALGDITYSDDEEDVGVEADFSNLETNITVSPIPTTRVHKHHPVTQIIGDLSLATQTRSMIRVVKDQGGATLIQHAEGLGIS